MSHIENHRFLNTSWRNQRKGTKQKHSEGAADTAFTVPGVRRQVILDHPVPVYSPCINIRSSSLHKNTEVFAIVYLPVSPPETNLSVTGVTYLILYYHSPATEYLLCVCILLRHLLRLKVQLYREKFSLHGFHMAF